MLFCFAYIQKFKFKRKLVNNMENNGVDVIIDELYDMIQNARGVPLASDKCILDRDKALDLLDEIITALPEDIKKARTIVSSRNELIAQARKEAEIAVTSAQSQAASTITSANSEAERTKASAKTEADGIVAKAKAQAQEMVTKEAIYAETQKQCQAMIDKANAQIAELRKVSNKYMDDALKRTEESIAASLKDVQETRAKFNMLAGEKKAAPVAKKAPAFVDVDID